jgi:Beta-galactosidase/beta-glucuronidase
MTFNKSITVLIGMIVCVCIMSAQAEFYPERIYKERAKIKLNTGWRFSQDDPNNPISGDPSTVAFSDASWKTVNIPHSASYDAPTKTGEDASFRGNCWYRKHFSVPATAKHTGKLFLQFDGAMQVADVWLNGKKLGTHDNSGYTGFSFDITDSGVSISGDNVLAVRLNNNYDTKIPPGCPGDGSGLGPDYYIFSGLYRNVWLVSADKCYIPLNGQQISVPQGPYPNGANVCIKTTIKNENAAAKSVKLRYVLAFDEKELNKGFLIDSMTQTVNANQSLVFNDTIGPILNPHLWSLDDPYLYRVFTQVFVDTVLSDDNVERFGVRWFTWTAQDKFKLNGQSVYLQGNSVHQMFPWIQNAASPTRFFKDLKLVKDMGVNLVRCAHYPRDPSFYNACDELGLLLFVEIPTWGNGKTTYPPDFWTRENACVKEMIDVGFNHPSIIGWGLFNEPGADFITQITQLNSIAKGLDSTRMTYMASNNTSNQIVKIPDIAGLNYAYVAAVQPTGLRTVNTEYHVGWLYDYAFRGDSRDIESVIAANFWKDWTDCKNEPTISGGTMWCHADYWSPMNPYPMGVVDVYRIPKSTYYLYRKNWRSVVDDNPVIGLSPSQLKLEADTNSLVADSVDCAFIYASIRDASGKCVHTGYETSSSTNVTFTVSGPANWFGPTTVKVNGGKCALLIKSKNTPGLITVIATSAGLPPDTVYINSVADTYDPATYPFFTPIVTKWNIPVFSKVSIKQYGKRLWVSFPSTGSVIKDVAIVNMKGQKLSCPTNLNGKTLLIDTRMLGTGFYYLSIGNNPQDLRAMKKIFISK